MKWFKWGDELLDGGYVQVPNALVKRQADLGLSPTDMDLIVQAAACFRQDDSMSPSGRILAERMGISERQVTRLKKRLVSLGYLTCTERTIVGRRITDDWDFSGLMVALKHLMSERPDTDVTPTSDADVTPGPDTDVRTSHAIPHTDNHTIVEDRPSEFTEYESNIGMLTPVIADKLKEAIDHYPKGWVSDAIKIAAENNARSWRYIEKILENWQAHGKDDGRPKEGGHGRRGAGTAGQHHGADSGELKESWAGH